MSQLGVETRARSIRLAKGVISEAGLDPQREVIEVIGLAATIATRFPDDVAQAVLQEAIEVGSLINGGYSTVDDIFAIADWILTSKVPTQKEKR
jgi:hypothetical protein